MIKYVTIAVIICVGLPAHAAQMLQCSFKGVGEREFSRQNSSDDFRSADGTVWQTLESEAFLQLRSAEIDPDYVTNPFTVYLYDKQSKRVRQISAAMRAAPMMADGKCQLTTEN